MSQTMTNEIRNSSLSQNKTEKQMKGKTMQHLCNCHQETEELKLIKCLYLQD